MGKRREEEGEREDEDGEDGRVCGIDERLLRLVGINDVIKGEEMAEHLRSIRRKVRRGE